MKILVSLTKILFFVLAVSWNTNHICAQENNRTSKILWQRDFGCGDNLSCSPGAVTFNKADNRLMIVGTSFQPKDYSEGKFWLWEIDQNGNVSKKTVLKDAPESFKAVIGLGPHLIKGIFAIGKFVDHTSSFMEMSRGGKVVSIKPISKKAVKENDMRILKKVDLPDGNCLLIGKSGQDNGMVIKANSRGGKLWEKTYNIGRLTFFTDGVSVGGEGGFLVVGCSTNVKGMFPAGQSNVYILRCGQRGNILNEEFFPGGSFPTKLPQVCQLGSGNFVLAYDKSTKVVTTDLKIRAFTPDLKVLWEKQVVKSEDAPPISFKIMAVPGGGFIVVDFVNFTDLEVHEYDKEGNNLSNISMDKTAWLGNFNLACSQDKVFIVSQPPPESSGGISKVKITAIEITPKK